MSAAPHRKPVHLERIGVAGGNRQRMWTWIRAHRERSWATLELANELNLNRHTVREYVVALCRGGFLTATDEAGHGVIVHHRYQFSRDNGVHAPRLNRDGQEVQQGRGTEAMWGTMRRADRDWDYRELAGLASTAAHPVSVQTAKSYVITLALAGYLVESVPAKVGKGARPTRYRLHPKHAKKPLAPMMQRIGAVYDPNEGRVVWTEEVDPDA